MKFQTVLLQATDTEPQKIRVVDRETNEFKDFTYNHAIESNQNHDMACMSYVDYNKLVKIKTLDNGYLYYNCKTNWTLEAEDFRYQLLYKLLAEVAEYEDKESFNHLKQNRLHYKDIAVQKIEAKEIYDSLKVKPEWVEVAELSLK